MVLYEFYDGNGNKHTIAADGKDGVSATHEWNGTTLTITSASGTSSADLKGKDGLDGKDGRTPQVGVDYFTNTDKEKMAREVSAALPTEDWVFTLDNGNTVTKKVVVAV